MAENAEEPIVTVKKVNKSKPKKAFVEEEDAEETVEVEEEEEEDDDEFEFDMDDMNLGTILQNFFVNQDGENVCEIMSGFKKSLDTQNKILMKIYTLLESRK